MIIDAHCHFWEESLMSDELREIIHGISDQFNFNPVLLMDGTAERLIKEMDEAGIDNKILAVPAKDPFFDKIIDIPDIPPSTLLEIKHFLEHYKDLEPGKWVKVEEWDNANIAKKEILKAIAMYKEKFVEGNH